ncbi:cytochrome c family protein [Corallococcus macrosporus]|uniref:Cytochrome c n=1 Tax=Corallococcus macrosporus DSM 14697 TaxID=1189310 RepID=A0A250K148_9BACT|nr:cytochrome c family protein [Corallococcus macrosporus]ATB49829.1 cytochrome c [Corallococcus macrosporus DSM 14697]
MRALLAVALVAASLVGCARKDPAPKPAEADASAAPTARPASAAKPAAPTEGAVLFVSADTRGYLGPCGCSENMRGGIARAAAQVRTARQGSLPVLYVDGGNSLFGERRLKPGQVPQEERKAQALADAMRQMGLAVRATGPLDDTQGVDFRKGLGLPELAPGQVKLFPAGAREVGVVAATTAAQLAQASAQAREQGADFVVGLLDVTLDVAQQAVEQPGLKADVVVATRTATEFSGEQNRLVRSAVPVVALQSKGRSLLRVDLAYAPQPGPFTLQKGQDDLEREANALEQRAALLDKDINLPGTDPRLKALKQRKRDELVARRQALLNAPPVAPAGVNAFTLRFVPLESSLPSDAEALAVVTAYDADVGKMNLAWAKAHGQDCPAPAPGRPGFVGNEPCRTCHEDAFPVWEKSKHHHAWETLEQVGKQFHLNCVGCHVTGWEQAGGVCRLDKVTGREDVGCESCHGPGSEHAEAPGTDNIIGSPGERVCITCHNAENSPHFDFATYLPRIVGPGHGKP